MEATNIFQRKHTVRSILLDILALATIYLIPTLTHLFSLPLYFIEPMRLMLILAIVHTHKANAYILALTLPLFSFMVSAHPVLPKMILITFELSLNVFLFYWFSRKVNSIFPAILLSILASKTAYYLLKFLLIQWTIIGSGLISTPLLIQGITTLAYSCYVWGMLRNQQNK